MPTFTPAIEAGAAPPRPGLLYGRQRSALLELLRLFAERRQTESEVLVRLGRTEAKLQEEGEESLKTLAAESGRDIERLDTDFEEQRKDLSARVRAELAEEQKAHEEAVDRFDADEAEAREKLRASFQDTLWAADSFLEAGQKRSQKRLDALKYKVDECRGQGVKLTKELTPLLKQAGIEADEVMPRRDVPPARGDSADDLQALMETAAALVEERAS